MYELKKVQFFDEMSEETSCFKAEIWEDGKLVADVSNTGKGGCNDIYVHSKENRNDIYNKYMELEYEIVKRADEIDQVRTMQTKGIVLKKDGKYYTLKFPMGISKWKKNPKFPQWKKINYMACKAKGYQIMNTNL